jgi:phosphoglucosamine mutase
LQHHAPLHAALESVERELRGEGRSLIRPSGTEPVVRVMVEHPDEHKAKAYAQRIASSIR